MRRDRKSLSEQFFALLGRSYMLTTRDFLRHCLELYLDYICKSLRTLTGYQTKCSSILSTSS